MKVALYLAIALSLAIGNSMLSAQDQATRDLAKSYADSSSVWNRVQTLAPTMTSRELFTYALLLCEANSDLDRLDRLFDVATRMQDRDRESRGFGNFRWNWRDGAVLDFNAGDFCMENAVVIWIKHRDLLSDAQRQALGELIDYAVQGSLNHRVPSSYTNIAIMNAQNLILLGETLQREDVLAEGRRRLNDFCAYTAINGIHEYSSPTYAGVDLMCLHRLHTHSSTPAVREQCEALLNLFWADAIANCFAPSFRLGGAHSRDYDYLGGRGILDGWLALAGCFEAPELTTRPPLTWLMSSWRPAPEWVRELQQAPRLVSQIWGPSTNEYRVMWAGNNVALSIAGKNYHNMDAPMVVNFPGPGTLPRGYFIADGRRDPYGKKVIAEGSGPHSKTLHLMPYWFAVQDQQDALGLALFRREDSKSYPTLESHFVLPYPCDELFIGDTPVRFDPQAPMAMPVPAGQAVVIRIGAAAAAIRIPWSMSTSRQTAPAALIHDGNSHGVIRLTVAHHDQWGMPIQPNWPVGAAFWIRVLDHADDPQAFARWRQDFATATAQIESTDDTLSVSVNAPNQPLRIISRSPFTGLSDATPLPPRAILAVNGKDIGGAFLANLPAVIDYQRILAAADLRQKDSAVTVLPDRETLWEAEDGAVYPNMVTADDSTASGNRYVWTPGEPGARGAGAGYVTWNLNVLKEGLYFFSAKVLAPTPDDDSFFVSVMGDKFAIIDQSTWHLPQTGDDWYWALYGNNDFPTGIAIRLPAGKTTLRMQVREDGAKLDQLRLSPEPGLH